MAVAVSNDLGDDGGSRRQMMAGNNVGDDVDNDVGNGDDGGNDAGNDADKGDGGDAGGEGYGSAMCAWPLETGFCFQSTGTLLQGSLRGHTPVQRCLWISSMFLFPVFS